MIRVLYFDWNSAGTEFYRLLPLDYIDEVNLRITRSTEINITYATLNSYDIIILERPSNATSLSIIQLAKSLGKYIISDWDDDCLHVDQYNPMYATYQDEMANVLKCLALSDEVWVSTEAIRKSFRLYNRNIRVIPNAHNDYLFAVDKKRPFTYNKLALWRGGHSHAGDMYDIGIPERVIEMVNSNRDWTFKFFGQRFEYLEKRCGDNYIACSGASTVQFHEMMHRENPCVAFYPLADTLFNRSKSNIFWLEMTYSGAAVFGNTNLPEYARVADFSTLDLGTPPSELEQINTSSWEYIQNNLLLSMVNKLRIGRLK